MNLPYLTPEETAILWIIVRRLTTEHEDGSLHHVYVTERLLDIPKAVFTKLKRFKYAGKTSKGRAYVTDRGFLRLGYVPSPTRNVHGILKAVYVKL